MQNWLEWHLPCRRMWSLRCTSHEQMAVISGGVVCSVAYTPSSPEIGYERSVSASDATCQRVQKEMKRGWKPEVRPSRLKCGDQARQIRSRFPELWTSIPTRAHCGK
jgi:hypothetical protein